ncbi:hypothetical protein SLA2020_378490 [Shorea laevis]
MDPLTFDLDTLISQTEALSWNDPTAQLATLPSEILPEESLALVGSVLSNKTLTAKIILEAMSKAWDFAVPFSLEVHDKNLIIFNFPP